MSRTSAGRTTWCGPGSRSSRRARRAYLDLRDDPWPVGDRVAWEESPLDVDPAARELPAPLVAARRPVVDLVVSRLSGPGSPR
ncbi:hypothetical protein ACIQMJ_11725 [Actinosynnema sp. NPDC091369]